MKLKCSCGKLVCDTGNEMSFKGHVLADQDRQVILDSVMECVEAASKDPARSDVYQRTASSWIDSKLRGIWKCEHCGRVAISDSGLTAHWFRPEEGTNVPDLLSARAPRKPL